MSTVGNLTLMDPQGFSTASDDEESFVVLGNGSLEEPTSFIQEMLPPIRTSRIHDMQELIGMEISQITNTHIPEAPAESLTTNEVTSSTSSNLLSPDSSYEEVQKHVEAVIRENEQLKNVIAQNNISMKNQYDKIITWKDDVNKVLKSYKEKFGEAKNYIDVLKDENAKLASDIEVYVNIKRLQEEEILHLKEHIKNLEAVQKIQGPDEGVTLGDEKVKDLQKALAEANLMNATISSENEVFKNKLSVISSLQEELQLKQVEISRLENQISAQNIKGKALSDDLVELQNQLSDMNITKNNTLEEHQKLINKEVVEKNLRIKLLEDQLQEAVKGENNNISVISSLKQELQLKHDQIVRLENQILAQNMKEKALSADLLELQNQLSETDIAQNTVIDEHQKLVNKELQEKNSKIKQLENKLQEALKGGNDLMAKISVLKIQVQQLEEANNPRLEEDYMKAREQLSLAQSTVIALQEDLNGKVKKVEELQKLLQGNSPEENFALKEQLEIYKADFEAEKESSNALKRERDRLAEDLQDLLKRNKQMQNELETFVARSQPKADGYTCPKCSFSFQNYQALENHVHRCLDLDGFP